MNTSDTLAALRHSSAPLGCVLTSAEPGSIHDGLVPVIVSRSEGSGLITGAGLRAFTGEQREFTKRLNLWLSISAVRQPRGHRVNNRSVCIPGAMPIGLMPTSWKH